MSFTRKQKVGGLNYCVEIPSIRNEPMMGGLQLTDKELQLKMSGTGAVGLNRALNPKPKQRNVNSSENKLGETTSEGRRALVTSREKRGSFKAIICAFSRRMGAEINQVFRS